MAHFVQELGHDRFMDEHASLAAHVIGLRETNRGTNENIGMMRTSSTNAQLTMNSMHRIPSLECHDAVPRQFLEASSLEASTQFSRDIC
jgi:hypothetical protein